MANNETTSKRQALVEALMAAAAEARRATDKAERLKKELSDFDQAAATKITIASLERSGVLTPTALLEID